jgi:hypothetical protein
MTKAQFKKEVVADLQHQLEHKGRPFTSEAWYYSDHLYSLKPHLKFAAIDELIAHGLINRVYSTEDGKPFPVLALCLPVALHP